MVFMSCIGWNANAQVAAVAIAAITDPGEIIRRVQESAYWVNSVKEMAESAINTYNQFQYMLRMEQMALDNLKGVTDVRSWDDLMTWVNRQLYLERQAEQKFMSMGVKVGGQNYRLTDIDKIPSAMKESYVDYWEKDFSPEQRREIWRKMGLSPANYTYIQTWKTREDAIVQKILAKKEIENDEYQENMKRNNEILEEIANDANMPEDQKMGEKELLSMVVETNVATNKKLNDIAYDLAEANELEAVRNKQHETPPNPPRLSESWNYSPFGPITE
jgi:hypothetical protein